MNTVINLVNDFGSWLASYNTYLSIAIVATFLVVFGGDLNSFAKRLFSSFHIVIRVIGFIVCSIGYGILTIYANSYLEKLIGSLAPIYVIVLVFVAYIFLAIFSNKRN